MCNGNVGILKKLVGVFHTLMLYFGSSSSIALTNMIAICSTFSFPVATNFLFSTISGKTRVNCGRLERTHSELRPHLTNRLCCGRSVCGLAIENVPAQQSTTRQPGTLSLRMVSFIQNLFLCSGRSNTQEPDALLPAQKTPPACGSREIFDV